MILEHLMEDKQLDLYQPFISVRRLPVPAPSSESEEKTKKKTEISLPVYKSELKSGPIRNPGTVPFLWEQTPGRPKDGGKTQTCFAQRPPIAPKLPPGRIWMGDVMSSSLNAESFREVLKKNDSSKNDDEDKQGSDSDDGSEAYMDARDTLSRTESSSFLNCSFSGLDGSYAKPFGTSSDQQTLDFMMERFLPAAKAMATESPHYTTRKQPLARDQPRQTNQSFHQHRPTNVEEHHTRIEEDSDSEPESPSAKGCGIGLLTQFCLLNPVPGLRMKNCGSISLVPRASSSKTQKKHYEDASLQKQNTKLKSESNSVAFKSNGKELEGASLYRRMQCNGIRELSSCQALVGKSTERESEEARNLYIDSMHVVKEMRESDSSFSDTKRNDLESLGNAEETRALVSSLEDIKNLTSSEKGDERIGSENDQLTESNTSDSSHLHLPPPLPKSPSESWLSRALPVVTSRKQSSFGTYRGQAYKIRSLDSKWETIVKTSNVHHGHLRFSEELLPPTTET